MKFGDNHAQQVPTVAFSSRSDLQRLSVALLQNEMPVAKPVRLLGVSLSSLQGDDEEEPQLGLPI
jgi:DNA polymerase IV